MTSILEQINKKNFINGEFVSYKTDFTRVTNPTKLDIVGEIPNITKENIIGAINSAESAFKTWSKTKPSERERLMKKLQELIMTNIDELATILTLEQGKPFLDSKKEIIYGANFLGWFANQAKTIAGFTQEGLKDRQKILIEYEPIGVVGAITPWNFPSAMITRKIAPALAAGCTIVLKPSELTPFSSLALGVLIKEAGFPAGVVNIITPEANMLSKVFEEDKRIRKISFTGSTRVGKILFEKSAKTLKKLSLELGGNAPFIVLDNANIELAANHLIDAKIRGTGQSCTSPNRIFVQRNVYDLFIEKIKDKFSNLRIGDGFNKDVVVGPLINKAATDKIERLLKDATNKGAKIILGGNKAKTYLDSDNNVAQATDNHTFFEPTIIKDCKQDMDIFMEEIFGPVLAIYKFETKDEVISLANNTDYGLASYVFTENLSDGFDISNQLDYGIVGINEGIVSNEVGAFGGRKESGFGVEGSILGIKEYLITKYKCINY